MNEFRVAVGNRSPLEEIVLVPDGKGKYEISVDGTLVYSKLQTGKHIGDGDVIGLIRAHLQR